MNFTLTSNLVQEPYGTCQNFDNQTSPEFGTELNGLLPYDKMQSICSTAIEVHTALQALMPS